MVEFRVTAAIGRQEGRLVAFAHGHMWIWARHQYPWANELRASLGSEATRLEGTHTFALLARDPHSRRRGLGREVLTHWLNAIGRSACWLQTTDAGSPARRLYESVGFTPIRHGPKAPNGASGLVIFRRHR